MGSRLNTTPCHFLSRSYNQALSSAQLACHKIENLGIVVKRPDDYFAEMVKTDDHMRKVTMVTIITTM